MKIDFKQFEEMAIPHFKGGEGQYLVKQFADEKVKIMLGKLASGSSIGMHSHETNSEIIYILSGVASFICDGKEEVLMPGEVHYNPMGKTHTLMNKGENDLLFFAVVPEHH